VSLIARTGTSPASRNSHVATHIHGHPTDRLPLIVHLDDSPHRSDPADTRYEPQSQRPCPDFVQPRIVSRLRATRILFSLGLFLWLKVAEQSHLRFNDLIDHFPHVPSGS